MRDMNDTGQVIQCIQRLQEGFAAPAANVAATQRVLDAVTELKSLVVTVDTGSDAAEEVSR